MRITRRDIVGGFVFSADDKILLGKSRKGGVYPGFWIVPGGGIDEGETQEEALRRELLEEVALDANDFTVQPLDFVLNGFSEKVLRSAGERVAVEMTFHNFILRSEKNASDLRVVCEDDFIDAQWFDTAGLSSLQISPPTKESFEALGLL